MGRTTTTTRWAIESDTIANDAPYGMPGVCNGGTIDDVQFAYRTGEGVILWRADYILLNHAAQISLSDAAYIAQ